MELIHLAAGLAHRDEVVRAAKDHTVVFECSDADTVLVAASLAGQLTGDFGVWLVITSAYTAQIAARDVKTLAAIVPLRHVVLEAPSRPELHAEVLRALLTNDEVNLSNDVATIAGAYNRPAPPVAVTVWSYDQHRLVSGDDVFSKLRDEGGDSVALTYYTD